MIERIQSRVARALEAQSPAKAIRTHSGAALGSAVGMVRKRNEDSCLFARASYGNSDRANFTVAVVCDGLGGMSQGREAAILAASAFTSYLFCSPAVELDARLARAAAYANKQIYQRLRGDGGTTLSAVISSDHRGAMLCHVGDSRIYGISPDRVLEQLSRDDTINALLNRHEGQADAPKDSRLLQFVGMGDEMEAQIASIPDHFRSVLLTSDGAHDVPNSVLQRVASAAAGGSDLIRKLLTLSEMLGGRDNASAILLPMNGEAEPYHNSGENELLVVLPTDALTMCFSASEAWERSGRQNSAPPATLREERTEPLEDAPPMDDGVKREASSKPGITKGKGRTAKPRKTKRRSTPSNAESPDRLPLEEPSNQVDVQFSSPSMLTGEDKK